MVLRFAWSDCDAVSVGQGLFFLIKGTSVAMPCAKLTFFVRFDSPGNVLD